MESNCTAQLWDIAITLRINILLNQGGISDWDQHREFINQFLERCLNEPNFTEAMMFHVGKKGLSTEAFNAATKAIAILAFVPGGVEFLGIHYNAYSL